MLCKINFKGGPLPLFSDTFDTKYRAENFTNTDSDTDTNTNVYKHMIVIIIHLLLYKYLNKACVSAYFSVLIRYGFLASTEPKI